MVEVREAQEAGAAAAGLAEQLKPRKAATTRDLMLPRPEHLEEIETWIDASSGNPRREIKVDTAIR